MSKLSGAFISSIFSDLSKRLLLVRYLFGGLVSLSFYLSESYKYRELQRPEYLVREVISLVSMPKLIQYVRSEVTASRNLP